MNSKFTILALIAFLSYCQLNSQDRIVVNIPSAKTETEYLWRTIQDINFFEAHNYQVSLPKGSLIEELKQKAKSGNLSDYDYEKLEEFVLDSVYNKAGYQMGYEKIKNELPLINQMINQLGRSRFSWGFKEFEIYTVNLTLYGPGGSYNPEEGSILIFTTDKGQFKNYDNPSNTIIHEIVHIGIEESIVMNYNVPHALKERIVDSFVSLNFGQLLPNYRIQDMGDKRTDPYLKKARNLKELDKIVEQILNGK